MLSGIRVVDLTRVWSGPLATRILADFGAEVIRIQRPITPGAMRISRADAERSGFYPGGDPGERPWNRNAFLNEFARNKRSVAVDLSHEEGREFVRRLVAVSDVVVENFSPRVMPNLGLDDDSLRSIRPDLIMASMPGYGANGPYRDRVAYGTTLEPEAGFSALMGYPGRGPQRLGVAYPDPVAGVHTAAAIIAALFHRHATGEGQHIEVAQLESACAFIGDALVEYQLTGKMPAPQGNRHPRFAPQGCYRCAGDDRWLTISVRTDAEWKALCRLIGRPALAEEPRFATAEARQTHHDDIDAVISDWAGHQEMHEAMAALQRGGIAAGAVLDARDMATDPHLEARGFFVDLSHPEAGRHRYPGQPIRLSTTPAVIQSDAPLHGADTRAVAMDLLRLSSGEYARLVERGTLTGIDEAAVGRSTR